MESNPPIPLSDLIKGCLANDRRAQEQLYRWLSPRLFAVCLRYAADREAAEDVLQEGFIKLFQKLSSFRGEGSFEGWARRIMVNTAIEYFRKKERTLLLVDLANADSESLPSNPSAVFEQKDLIKLIQGLAPGFRMVFNLFAIEGYSHQEIADELGVSESTSKTQFRKARNYLMNIIVERENI